MDFKKKYEKDRAKEMECENRGRPVWWEGISTLNVNAIICTLRNL